ncbi:MAG: hypothetical protein FJ315_03960 [SAR202 cluster bacterium]|nr:hypothetical protein [SAR202 cluster bacterium]
MNAARLSLAARQGSSVSLETFPMGDGVYPVVTNSELDAAKSFLRGVERFRALPPAALDAAVLDMELRSYVADE